MWLLGFQPRYLFRCYLLARCTEKDIVGKSFAIKALKPSGNFFTAFMWQKLKNRKSTTPTIVCPRIMLIENLDPVQNVSFVVLSIKLGFLIPQPFPHRYPPITKTSSVFEVKSTILLINDLLSEARNDILPSLSIIRMAPRMSSGNLFKEQSSALK